jgi:2-methylisocitrate lyase-like PEP mutase family enzyme
MVAERNWKKLLRKHAPLLLPAACDALTAKLIRDAGFPAYQVGGFALDGARFGYPDMDLSRLGEKSEAVREILRAVDLPVLVDADDGYGDAKNVTHTVHVYEEMGASALFIEDQKAPKRCGHMAGKEVIPAKEMVSKLKAAVAARSHRDSLFVIARSDALEPNGVLDALKRAEMYLNAGVDGLYIEGPHDEKQMRIIGREFRGVPLAITMLEGGGRTPWTSPAELGELGYSMILYPTTLLFRMTRAIQRGLADLKAGRPITRQNAVDMFEFEKIVDIAYWKAVEQQVLPLPERVRQKVNKIFKKVA